MLSYFTIGGAQAAGYQDMTPITPIQLAASLQFDRPWLLMGLAVVCLPIVIAMVSRRRGLSVAIGWLSVGLQCVAVGAVVVALAGPRLSLGGVADMPWLLLRDASASMRKQASPQLPADLPCEVQDFGDSLSPDVWRGTDVGPALRLAAARAKQISGAIIWTDGQFGDDDWRGAAAVLGQAGVEVFIAPAANPPGDASISNFQATRRLDGAVQLRATVTSNTPQLRTLKVYRAGSPDAPIFERTLDLAAGEAATFDLVERSEPADASAAITYYAELSGGDSFAENDSVSAILLPSVRRVAIIAAGPDDLPPIASGQAGMQLEYIAPADAPSDKRGWLDFAAVVLVDSTGRLLDGRQRAALGEYVTGGGGLLLIGAAPHESPADRDDPLNKVAALVANPYERRPMDVTVVLDASGSMAQRVSLENQAGQAAKFDLATEAVAALKRHLTAADRLAVITFSDRSAVAYDSGAGAPDFAALRDALSAVAPGGPTHLMAALKLAAGRPHQPQRTSLVILISDLMPTGPFSAVEAASLLAGPDRSLAIVATASPGEPAPQTAGLERLAELTGAPLVRRDRLAGLAKVFGGFIRSARGDAVRRGRFTATSAAELFGVRIASQPQIDAYILSAAHNEAQVLMDIGGDVVAARRRAGMGRSVSLAVPLGPEENDSLRSWPQLPDVLAAAVRWAMRSGEDPRFDGEIVHSTEGLTLAVTAVDAGRPMNMLDLVASVTPSGGRGFDVPLRQVAPGKYEALLSSTGPVGVAVRRVGGRAVWRTNLAGGYPPEFAGIGPDWSNLRSLAELTGGKLVSSAEVPASVVALAQKQYTPAWPYLLAIALASMLGEWLLRRVRRK